MRDNSPPDATWATGRGSIVGCRRQQQLDPVGAVPPSTVRPATSTRNTLPAMPELGERLAARRLQSAPASAQRDAVSRAAMRSACAEAAPCSRARRGQRARPRRRWRRPARAGPCPRRAPIRSFRRSVAAARRRSRGDLRSRRSTRAPQRARTGRDPIEEAASLRAPPGPRAPSPRARSSPVSSEAACSSAAYARPRHVDRTGAVEPQRRRGARQRIDERRVVAGTIALAEQLALLGERTVRPRRCAARSVADLLGARPPLPRRAAPRASSSACAAATLAVRRRHLADQRSVRRVTGGVERAALVLGRAQPHLHVLTRRGHEQAPRQRRDRSSRSCDPTPARGCGPMRSTRRASTSGSSGSGRSSRERRDVRVRPEPRVGLELALDPRLLGPRVRPGRHRRRRRTADRSPSPAASCRRRSRR